jgi:hypothetical protein
VRTIHYSELLAKTVSVSGLEYENLLAADEAALRTLLSMRIGEVFETIEHDQLRVYEERTVVLGGDDVRRVMLEATGKTTIDRVLGVTVTDPRVAGVPAIKVDHERQDESIVILDEVSTVWVSFIPVWNGLSGNVWDATAIYAAGDYVYFEDQAGNGDFYQAITLTVAGESPSTTPAKWSVVRIPKVFADFIALAAASDFCGPDDDKQAAILQNKAYARLQGVIQPSSESVRISFTR